jgi:arylsulfatase A-like enzyme
MRMMEVFAGYLEHTDHHIGRLIDYLATSAELDNTLIMLISDSGASSEGGPSGSTNENKLFKTVRTIELYRPPFAFTGTIFKVTADLPGQMLQDTEEERKTAARMAIGRQ